MIIQNQIRQAKTLLFSFRTYVLTHAAIVPVLTLIMHMIGFAAYYRLMVTGREPKIIEKLDIINCQASDTSFIFLILMFATSKNYKASSWIAFICLFLLLVINTVYRLAFIEPDVYYTTFSWIIYAIFVIGAVIALTRRC